jgi:ABC-type nitrate/sulfonate/bicarbonate transport system permease component
MTAIPRSTALKVAGLAAMFAAWQLYATLSGNRLTPGLGLIVAKFVTLLAGGDLVRAAGATLSEGLAGLAIAFTAGTLTGFCAASNWVVGAALRPIVSLGYPVPKLALYPIVILMLGFGGGSKIAQVALECFFPIFVNSFAGARAVDRNMMWLARNAGAGRRVVVRDIMLPAALPSVLTGLRIAAPIMLIVMTVTELIGDSQGLGYLIARSASYFDSASAYALVGTLGAIGFVGDRLIVWARRRLVYWEKGASL